MERSFPKLTRFVPYRFWRKTMRKLRLESALVAVLMAAALAFAPAMLERPAFSQETTGGLQGSVKDPSGAVVPKAKVVLTSSAMVGSKELVTDSSGYYRF